MAERIDNGAIPGPLRTVTYQKQLIPFAPPRSDIVEKYGDAGLKAFNEASNAILGSVVGPRIEKSLHYLSDSLILSDFTYVLRKVALVYSALGADKYVGHLYLGKADLINSLISVVNSVNQDGSKKNVFDRAERALLDYVRSVILLQPFASSRPGYSFIKQCCRVFKMNSGVTFDDLVAVLILGYGYSDIVELGLYQYFLSSLCDQISKSGFRINQLSNLMTVTSEFVKTPSLSFCYDTMAGAVTITSRKPYILLKKGYERALKNDHPEFFMFLVTICRRLGFDFLFGDGATMCIPSLIGCEIKGNVLLAPDVYIANQVVCSDFSSGIPVQGTNLHPTETKPVRMFDQPTLNNLLTSFRRDFESFIFSSGLPIRYSIFRPRIEIKKGFKDYHFSIDYAYVSESDIQKWVLLDE